MGLFCLDFGCAVLSGLLELAFPLAVTAFIDHLLPQGNWTLTVAAAAGLLALYAINAGLLTVVIYWATSLASISRPKCAPAPSTT
jgi:ATP-binding cassette subfamily B protein